MLQAKYICKYLIKEIGRFLLVLKNPSLTLRWDITTIRNSRKLQWLHCTWFFFSTIVHPKMKKPFSNCCPFSRQHVSQYAMSEIWKATKSSKWLTKINSYFSFPTFCTNVACLFWNMSYDRWKINKCIQTELIKEKNAFRSLSAIRNLIYSLFIFGRYPFLTLIN